MSGPAVVTKMANESRFSVSIQFLVHLLLIFLCVGDGVPGINESHYLPKAKHVWNANFAPGDLFLASHDSHLLSSALAGLAAIWLPLDTVAWIGRLTSWSLLAFAWLRLCQSLNIPRILSPFALVTWVLGIAYGHWAGEWVVGGFEAKAIAYPCVLLGIAAASIGNWQQTWLWLACAVAWHPVVGGWAGICVGLSWLLLPRLSQRFVQQLPWLALGVCIGLIGVGPAFSGLGGPSVIDNVSAAQVHVYMRLPHHLSPQLFAPERHTAAIVSLVVLAISTLVYRLSISVRSRVACQNYRVLLTSAWFSVFFASIGWLIDWSLSNSRPDIAAPILRFYWFRWADAAVPLASSLVLWKWLSMANSLSGSPREETKSMPRPHHRGLLGLALAASTIVLLARLPWSETRVLPSADRLVVDSVGKIDRQSVDRFVDWLAVCQWIRENSPHDSLWFTPKYQQTFKWYAQRAEVVCWKDVPQDNAAVIEWYHRIQRCAPQRMPNGEQRDWTTEELLKLSAEYGFRWVLLDKTQQLNAPALEILYPLIENGYYPDNRSFAVFRIPEWMLDSHRK